MTQLVYFSNVVLRSGVWWGVALAVCFYAPWNSVLWNNPLAARMLAAHPASIVETGLFLVAAATLAIRLWRMIGEWFTLGRPLLASAVAGGQPADTCGHLLRALAELPPSRQDFFLARRLRDALESVSRRGGAEALDDELKHLAAGDRRRMFASYLFVLVIAVLIGLVGIAATVAASAGVLGRALGAQSATQAELLAAEVVSAFDPAILAVLFVAGTICALGVAWAVERRVLELVDAQAARELAGRFQQFGSANDPHLLAVRRMADAVVQVTERLVRRQTELWNSTVNAAHAEWSRLASASMEQSRLALEATLVPSLREFAQRLAATAAESHAQNQQLCRQLLAAPGGCSPAPAPPYPLPPDRAENRAA